MAFSLFKKFTSKETKPDAAAGPHYFDLKVSRIIQQTRDAITIVFDNPPSGPIPYKSGQFLTLIADVNGKEVRRAYSLNSSPFVDEQMAVTVKRVDGGLMSNWLPDHLKEGQTLKVMAPTGHFTTTYQADRKRHLIMFSGGSGITPMMSLIKSVLSQEPDSIVSLLYCNRNIDSIIFKDELAKLETKYEGRLHVIHLLDEAPMNWQGMSGLLNKDVLTKMFERIPDWGIDKTTYLMCGPEGMMKNVESLLTAQHIPAEKIIKESFVPPTLDKDTKKETAAAGQSQDRTVTIKYDGQTYEVKVKAGRHILESALDQGIDLPYSCQSGLCTACRGKALSGQVKLDEEEGLSQSEKAQGYVLTCVGRPLSDDVVIEIG